MCLWQLAAGHVVAHSPPPPSPRVSVTMEAGITYDVLREVVALDDNTHLPSSVVFLGRHFLLPQGEGVWRARSPAHNVLVFISLTADESAFSRHVRSRIWCSYRRGFKAISEQTRVM